MNNIGYFVTLSLLVFLSTGCSHRYIGNPELFEVTYERAPPIEINGKINFINGHDNNDEQIFLRMAGHKHIADFHQFADSIIKLTELSLIERGMNEQESDKSLKITIRKIEKIPAMWVYRIITHVEVEDHLGNKYQIKGDNASGGVLPRAVNGSLYRVVTTLLNDKSIQNYLSK